MRASFSVLISMVQFPNLEFSCYPPRRVGRDACIIGQVLGPGRRRPREGYVVSPLTSERSGLER